MKTKTIKAVLRKKIDKWLKSIDDEDLRLNIYDNCIVTGGAIASMVMNEEVNDFDVYFTNKQTVLRVARYYLKKFIANTTSNRWNAKTMYVVDEDESSKTEGRIKIMVRSDGEAEDEDAESPASPAAPGTEEVKRQAADAMDEDQKAEKGEFRPIYITANAISLSDDVQLVIRFYGDPQEIHKNYDFVHATNWWTSTDGHLELNVDALMALSNKDLVYIGSLYPLASMIRVRKFLQRGFTINAGQLLKIAWQISELDMSDVKVLEEQLTGVDVAYFMSLISELRTFQKENPGETFGYNKVSELIDKIF